MNDKGLHNLVESLNALQCTTREASEKIAAMSRALQQHADLFMIVERTHENWPELCSCDECREMRETIAEIADSVLP